MFWFLAACAMAAVGAAAGTYACVPGPKRQMLAEHAEETFYRAGAGLAGLGRAD